MQTFKVKGNVGVTLDGKTYTKGQTFEADPKRMERNLKRGWVEKELKEPKSTKELKVEKKTK